MPTGPVRDLMTYYPSIYLACHTRHVRDAKSGETLSAHQASILDHLDDREPTGLLGLAKHMGVTPSTMCIHVNRLARSGYVTRQRDSGDARRVKLLLTKSGVSMKRANSVLDADLVASMLRRLNGKERKEAIGGLALLARAAGEEMSTRSAVRERAKEIGREV
ncbi:MAG: MarR family winged helix-turn-helix transcriptional regulator [Bryobacteraceae bacterium]